MDNFKKPDAYKNINSSSCDKKLIKPFKTKISYIK